MSRPTRGEWIEIALRREKPVLDEKSRPTRGEWIEIILVPTCFHRFQRLAPRGASGLKWLPGQMRPSRCPVSPHAGRVD